MTYERKISTRVNLLSDRLLKEEQELKKARAVRRTKEELHEILSGTLKAVGEGARELDKYHSALEPIKAGDSSNSLFDELSKLREDISTAQFLLVHGKTAEADQLLQEIKERI